jgi:hypothetical protein
VLKRRVVLSTGYRTSEEANSVRKGKHSEIGKSARSLTKVAAKIRRNQVTNLVRRIDLERGLEALVVSDLSGQTHSLPRRLVGEKERGNRVVVLARLDRKPGSKEDDVCVGRRRKRGSDQKRGKVSEGHLRRAVERIRLERGRRRTAHQDLVLERRSESSIRLGHRLLDLPTHA